MDTNLLPRKKRLEQGDKKDRALKQRRCLTKWHCPHRHKPETYARKAKYHPQKQGSLLIDLKKLATTNIERKQHEQGQAEKEPVKQCGDNRGVCADLFDKNTSQYSKRHCA